MTKDHLPRLTELIAAMAATFNREVDEAMYLGYELALSDLSIEQIQDAVERALKTCKFMPTGAELRELAGDVSPKERAIIALGVVEAAILSHGFYDSVNFDHPLVNATIRSLGGWEKACTLEDRFDIAEWGRNFKATYAALCRNGASRTACAPLLGLINRQNGFNGYRAKGPVCIECGLAPHPEGLVRIGGSSRPKALPTLTLKRAE